MASARQSPSGWPTRPPRRPSRAAAAVEEIRRYAAESLGLPDNRSYTAYADLQRPAAVWNVFATPELSLELKTCATGAGCAGYRGYFRARRRRGDGRRTGGRRLRRERRAVPAYSTLGWFDDPLLNTFIYAPDVELARLVFHELSHQVVYARDDTVFNESFATAVEREGVRRWLAATATSASGRPGPLHDAAG